MQANLKSIPVKAGDLLLDRFDRAIGPKLIDLLKLRDFDERHELCLVLIEHVLQTARRLKHQFIQRTGSIAENLVVDREDELDHQFCRVNACACADKVPESGNLEFSSFD